MRRHLTYANVMASVAVFVALGGGAYAAVQVNGKDIKNRTITAKKLKNNTLGGKQINEKRLGRVPSAARAQSAARADTADTAASATSAGTAATATRAASADTAATAANADNANELGGAPPEVYFVDCPTGTTLYGGMCWDNTSRAATGWIFASDTCGNAGGRLPTLSELIAYSDQTGPQLTGQHWSSEVVDVATGPTTNLIGIADDTSDSSAAIGASVSYRCLFYRTN